MADQFTREIHKPSPASKSEFVLARLEEGRGQVVMA